MTDHFSRKLTPPLTKILKRLATGSELGCHTSKLFLSGKLLISLLTKMLQSLIDAILLLNRSVVMAANFTTFAA